MGWLDRVDDQVDALTHARALQEASRSAEAYVLLERVIRTTADPAARADALVQRLSALINLGRTAEFTRAIEEASAAVRDLAEPYLHGHLNALAALAAHHQGALDRCVMHLVRAARALGAVADPDRDTAWGWHDLAMAYSYLSFHGYALGAIERARQLGLTAGIPRGDVRRAGHPAAQRGGPGPQRRQRRLSAGAPGRGRRPGPLRPHRAGRPATPEQPRRVRLRGGSAGGARRPGGDHRRPSRPG